MTHLKHLKDNQLLEKFSQLVLQEREATASVVAHLAEIDRRKLYAKEGFSSLFSYCVEKYRYSEGACYKRIYAARMSQKFPEIISLLEAGKISLTIINLIGAHLTEENKESLLKAVTYQSKRGVEKIIAGFFPKTEEIPDKIRRLPTPEGKIAQHLTLAGGSSDKEGAETLSLSAPVEKKRGAVIKPVTEREVKIEFRASERLARKIERAREILRYKYSQAKLEDIFNEALEALLEKKDPERKIARMEKRNEGQTERKTQGEADFPAFVGNDGASSRYIPQEIRRQVWKRDQGTCVYEGPDGKHCGERACLEVDHIKPWALGGQSTAENLQLLCRTHNRYRAQQTFGLFRR